MTTNGWDVFGMNTNTQDLVRRCQISEDVTREAGLFNCPDDDNSERFVNFPIFRIEGDDLGYESGTRQIQFKKDSTLIRQKRADSDYPFHFLAKDFYQVKNKKMEVVIVDDILKELALHSNISRRKDYVFISLLQSFKHNIDPYFLDRINRWFSHIPWQDRNVTIIPNTEYFDRGEVYKSVEKIVQSLSVLGAYSRVLDLRVKGHESIGVDDYLQIYGANSLETLLGSNSENNL